MSGTLTTKIVFNGINNVSRTVGTIQKSVGGLSKTLSGIGRGARMGGFLSVASVTAPLVAAAKSAFDTTVQFEEAGNAYRAVNLKVKDLAGTMEFARKTAIELGKTSFFTPVEIMKAERALAMMGLSGEVSFDKFGKKITEVSAILKDAVNLAAAGQIGIEDSADRLTNATLGFHGKAFEKDANGNSTGKIDIDKFSSQTAEMADVIAATATSANASVNQVLKSMKEAAPIARVLGIDITELGARIGAMADNGFKGAEAGRSFRTAMLRIISPTAKMQTTLAGLGIPLDKFMQFSDKMLTAQNLINRAGHKGIDITKKAGEISRILGDSTKNINQKNLSLKEFFKGDLNKSDALKTIKIVDDFIVGAVKSVNFKALVDQVKSKLGNEGATGFWESVFGKKQVAKFLAQTMAPEAVQVLQDTIIKKIGNRDGSYAAEMAAALMQGLPGALRRLQSTFQSFQVEMIKPIAGEIASAFKGLRGIFDDIIQNTTKLQKKLMIFGAIGAAVIGPLLIYFGLAAMGLGALVRTFAMLLVPLKIVARVAAVLAGSLMAITKGGALARGALMRLGVVGAVLAAAWYGAKEVISSFSAAIMLSPEASAKASQAMVALRAALRNVGDGNYKDAFSWFKLSVKRFKETVELALPPTIKLLKAKLALLKFDIINSLEGLSDVDIDFGVKFDEFEKSITRLMEALGPFGAVWESFKKNFSSEDGGLDGLKRFGETFAGFGFSVATLAINVMAEAIERLSAASKELSNGNIGKAFDEFAKFEVDLSDLGESWDKLKKIIGDPFVIKLGPSWGIWYNKIDKFIDKAIKKIEQLSQSIKDMFRGWGLQMFGIDVGKADVTLPRAKFIKSKDNFTQEKSDFAANDNRVGGLNGVTIAELKGQNDAANIVKAAAELAAKEAERTTEAVKAQTGEQARNTAQIVGAINGIALSNFSSAGHWQGNPASEAVGAPDAPIHISSNGGAGIHP